MRAEEQRLETAADWLLRLRDPAILPGEIADWHAWCEEDPRNKQAFARMQSLWRESGALEERPVADAALEADGYRAQVPVKEWRTAHPPQRRPRHRPALIGLGAAAGVAVLAAALWFVHGSVQRNAVHQVSISATEGTKREVTLPDGTSVTAVDGATLTTRYTAHERHIFLARGKAFFRVERDPLRPFVVHALDTKVTAVGTAFVVSTGERVVEVAVTEGAVNVGRPQPVFLDAPGGHGFAGVANVRVEAGYQIKLTEEVPAPEFASIDPMEVEVAVTGTLQFTDEPLSSVVGIVNRHASVAFSVGDERVGNLRFTGTVVIDRIDEWLRGLPDIFPVRIEGDSATGAVILPAGH